MVWSRAKLVDASPARSENIFALLGLMEPGGADVSARWMTRYLYDVSALWPLMLLTKLLIAIALAGSFFSISNLWQPLTLVMMVLVDGAIILVPRLTFFQRLRPHLRKWLLLVALFMSGAVSSTLFSGIDLLGLGSSFLSTAPQFAIAMLAVCVFGDRRLLGLSYFLGSLPVLLAQQHGLLPIFLFITCSAMMLVTIVRQARTDQERMHNEYERERSALRSDRLLHEYERSGRGWFWETDRNGCVTYVSSTLLETLNVPEGGLIGRPIIDMVHTGHRGQGEGDRTLGLHLSARISFSDLAVRAAWSDEDRWWNISGQPVFNEFGQFQGFLGSGTDLTEMRRSQAEVERLAQYDSLTGLANRMHVLRALEHAITGAGPSGAGADCVLMMLDLDRFKNVNDTLGHPAGDALLRQVSGRLQKVIANRGIVGRQGGDEFKVVLHGTQDPAHLKVLARSIIDTISEPYIIEGTSVVIGVSIGLAISPNDGVTADALIRNADLALYAAKGDGRGTYRFYSPEMHSDAEDRRQLEEDLRRALASDGLHLVYQPVVCSSTEKVVGYEALLRWTHPVRGPISPAIFVPIAEDTGLIGPIGDWVLRTACHDAAQWDDSTRVAVNVSSIQFANPSLPVTVMNALASAQLAPERLELEITESVFLNDDSSTEAMFGRLKAIGVRLALDDFGTGYSSLGYLKKAPFDKIKIDQSFVRGAAIAGNRNSAIIKAIVNLAEALGMDTTAEGAETHDELALIRRLGCSHIQGYIYGRPMPFDDVLKRQKEGQSPAKPEGFLAYRPDRKTMLRTVSIIHAGKVYTARIRNISPNGAMIEGIWNVPVGTKFVVDFGENQSVNASARWAAEDRMGVKFAVALDLTKMLVMTQRLVAS